MTTPGFKNEFGICRCCLSEGTHRDFRQTYECDDLKKENADAQKVSSECYSDMFYDCYKFPLLLKNTTTLICMDCIKNLRTASEFKQKVLDSTKDLLSIDVDPQNLAKEKDDNNYTNKPTRDKIEHTGSNLDDTKKTDKNNSQKPMTELLGNLIDFCYIKKDVDSENSVTDPDLLKNNDKVLQHAFGFVSGGKKGTEFMLHNGLKVKMVKVAPENKNNAREVNMTALADQYTDTSLKINNAKSSTVTTVETEEQTPPFASERDKYSKDCTDLPIKRENQGPLIFGDVLPAETDTFSEDWTMNAKEDELLAPLEKKKSKKFKANEKQLKGGQAKKKEGSGQNQKETVNKSYPCIEDEKNPKSKPVPDSIKTKRGRKPRLNITRMNPLEEITYVPKSINSYSRKKQCLNTIRISEPVSIANSQFNSLSQHVGVDPNQATAVNKETATLNLTENAIESLNLTTHSDHKTQDIDLKCDENSSQSMTQLFPISVQEDNIGTLSFSREMELDFPPVKRLAPLKNNDLPKDDPCINPIVPWRILINNKSKQDGAPNKINTSENTSQVSKVEPTKTENDNTTENDKQLATNDKQLATNDKQLATNEKQLAANDKQLGTNDKQLAANDKQLVTDEDEELKAYREKLLSGYVRKPITIDQETYKQAMKELIQQRSTTVYRCKTCSLVFMCESSLFEHKEKIHKEKVKGEDVTTNAQTPKLLTAAPGIKVKNQMYKTNNKGLTIIYASDNCFYKSLKTEDGQIAWICRTHHQCAATLYTKNDEIVAYNDNHTPRIYYKPAKNPTSGKEKTAQKQLSVEGKEQSITKKSTTKRNATSLPETQTSATKKRRSEAEIQKNTSLKNRKSDGESDATDSSSNREDAFSPSARPRRENRQMPKKFESYTRLDRKKQTVNRSSVSSPDDQSVKSAAVTKGDGGNKCGQKRQKRRRGKDPFVINEESLEYFDAIFEGKPSSLVKASASNKK